jgi:uncharacterized protein (DUF305 family)
MLLVGLGFGYILWGNVGSYRGTDVRGSHMSRNIDQHFITQMIPHHEGAIVMAEIALTRSKRPEILSLAQGIIEAQKLENTDMRAWYEAWFGGTPGTGHGMMHMDGMSGDVSELSSVPDTDFDREFIEQMIPHHEMAIMMAQMLSASTGRAEMRTLAENIITSQSREIQMMRAWLKSWYGTP